MRFKAKQAQEVSHLQCIHPTHRSSLGLDPSNCVVGSGFEGRLVSQNGIGDDKDFSRNIASSRKTKSEREGEERFGLGD
ncbi:hypothetical protein, partial [Devosia sp. Leaf420]|uniref:hypothetical protein n=1 Tax=Devosia sp. Leaf420 TaxID=1736374 RepID=UPI001AEC4232